MSLDDALKTIAKDSAKGALKAEEKQAAETDMKNQEMKNFSQKKAQESDMLKGAGTD